MISITGKVVVDATRKRLVVDVSDDIIRLYYWFISTKYWIRMNTPMHGAHVTIFNQKKHTDIDWSKAKKYHGKKIELNYDPYLIQGGFTKGFVMFYLKVYSAEVDSIKKDLGIVDGESYRGLHITISNSKGMTIYPSWPKLIEIREENGIIITK